MFYNAFLSAVLCLCARFLQGLWVYFCFSLRTSVVECSCVTLQHVPNMRTHFISMVDVLRDDGLMLFSEKSLASLIRETLVLVGWLCFYNERIDINVRFATALLSELLLERINQYVLTNHNPEH